MEPRTLLNALAVAERLKGTTRHCYTSNGRRESVAEHSWMMTLMAFFLQEEFPEADMNKVIRMCIIHDLGEAFTGDIPSFEKSPGGRGSGGDAAAPVGGLPPGVLRPGNGGTVRGDGPAEHLGGQAL